MAIQFIPTISRIKIKFYFFGKLLFKCIMNKHPTISSINNLIEYIIVHVLYYHYHSFISQVQHIYMQVNSEIDIFVSFSLIVVSHICIMISIKNNLIITLCIEFLQLYCCNDKDECFFSYDSKHRVSLQVEFFRNAIIE